ncbi:hypothetical protein RRG08_045354, partial [Elysia crispata]
RKPLRKYRKVPRTRKRGETWVSQVRREVAGKQHKQPKTNQAVTSIQHKQPKTSQAVTGSIQHKQPKTSQAVTEAFSTSNQKPAKQ